MTTSMGVVWLATQIPSERGLIFQQNVKGNRIKKLLKVPIDQIGMVGSKEGWKADINYPFYANLLRKRLAVGGS